MKKMTRLDYEKLNHDKEALKKFVENIKKDEITFGMLNLIGREDCVHLKNGDSFHVVYRSNIYGGEEVECITNIKISDVEEKIFYIPARWVAEGTLQIKAGSLDEAKEIYKISPNKALISNKYKVIRDTVKII